MELNIGDKVRYLDAVGGGVVLAFKGKDLVVVLEEDGFETPILRRQCVVIESANAALEQKKANAKTVTSTSTGLGITTPPKTLHRDTIVPRPMIFKQPQSREGELITLSLAFLPAEGHSFQESIFESYLINESNYSIMFNYASCSGKSWTSRCVGVVEPNSKLFLEEFGRQSLPDMEKVCLQMVAYKTDLPYSFKNSLSIEIRLDTIKFYKIHCFKENDFFDEDALVVSIVRNDVPERALISDPEVIRQAMLVKQTEKPRVSVPLEKKQGPIEVDLHINNLLDSTAGMDAAAILQHQLDVFRKYMKEYKLNKGTKLVFIHGKGEGVLRAAILKELKADYKTCRSQDASFREYGFGATMVVVG
jgi:hypothetical protein